MKALRTTSALALLTALLLLQACGGEEPQDDLIQCGEGTVATDGLCVPEETTCLDGELQLSDGTCVRVDYCGDGTTFQESTGTCVAPPLICGPNTEPNEDNLCEAGPRPECGEGTVVASAQCVPYDDVCGSGTAPDINQGCLPRPDVCGEGTTFDVNDLVCVPLSNITCGPGTIAVEGLCISLTDFYTNLAEGPDLDLTDAALDPDTDPHITLKDQGERFVILGRIDVPEVVDGELVANVDRVTFDADAGQWLRVGIFSLGLPDPGFLVSDDADYYRYTNLAAAGDISRYVVVPETGTMSLSMSSLQQLLGQRPPAGGDDWDYVAYVEVVEAPAAQPRDLATENFSGNILSLQNNRYLIEDVSPGDALALVFSTQPTRTDAEVMIFDDQGVLTERKALASTVLMEIPSESFTLLFDSVYSFGIPTSYSATGQVGSSLVAGQTASETFSLAAGEYLGVFQFNLDDVSLAARVLAGASVLAETAALVPSNSVLGQISLYAYTPQARTVTVEVENTTGDDLDFFALSTVIGEASSFDGVDGDAVTFTRSAGLPRGHRHYVEVDVEFTGLLRVSSNQDVRLSLTGPNGNLLASGDGAVVVDTTAGLHTLAVEARANLNSGFSVTFEESEIFEVSETSSPNVAIPDSTPAGVNDTITIGSCPQVQDIDMDINIVHTFRGDLIVRLTSPEGTTHTLKSRFGGSTDNIVGNFNTTLTAGGTGAVPIDSFVGEAGTGEWILNVSDNVGGDTGTLNSWTLNLTCE